MNATRTLLDPDYRPRAIKLLLKKENTKRKNNYSQNLFREFSFLEFSSFAFK